MASSAAPSNEQSFVSWAKSFLSQHGFTGNQLLIGTSALAGNVQQESGFRASAYGANDGGPGVNAHGIVQWEGGRYTNLLNYARSTHGDANTLATQEGFLGYELTHGYSGVLSALRTSTSVDAAAQEVQAHYEVSAPGSLGARQANARTIYSQLVNGQPLTLGGASSGGAGDTSGGSGIQLASAVQSGSGGALTDILPGGNWDPLNWPGNITSTVTGGVADAVTQTVEGWAGPIVRWLLNAFLVVSGIIIVVIAVVLLAKDSESTQPTSALALPTKGNGEHSAEREKDGAGGEAEEAAAL